MTVVTQTGSHVDLSKSLMSIDEMLRYRHTVVADLDGRLLELDALRGNDIECCRCIDMLDRDLL